MTIANQYPKLGDLSIIPAADLTDLTAACNVKSPARLGDGGIGKKGGTIAVRNSSGNYSLVIALGSAAASVWEVLDGSATYTPA